MYNVWNTLYPEDVKAVIAHSNSQRFSVQGEQMKAESIMITEAWQEELASMPSCRCSCSGNVIGDGRFIIAGGYSEPADEEGALNGWLSSCLAYEPKDNSWSTLRSMPTPRADHATAAVACSLFVVRDQPP